MLKGGLQFQASRHAVHHRVCTMGWIKFWRNHLILLRLLFHEIVLKCLSRQVYDVKKYHKKYYLCTAIWQCFVFTWQEKMWRNLNLMMAFWGQKSSVPGGSDCWYLKESSWNLNILHFFWNPCSSRYENLCQPTARRFRYFSRGCRQAVFLCTLRLWDFHWVKKKLHLRMSSCLHKGKTAQPSW